MPLEERVLEPVYVSRGIIDGQKNIYNLLPNELECFSNETLANIIKQLSSLALYAEDLFASILQDSTNIHKRTMILQQKMNNLAVKVTQLDAVNEDVSLHDIHLKKPYKPQNITAQEIFSKKTLPKSILEIYNRCSRPPPLDLLNPFREDGKDSMKFYTNPNFFFELWRDAMLKQVEKEKNNKKLNHRLSNKMQNGNLADCKEQRKPRQPANSNERYRNMVSQQEFLVADDQLPNRNVIYMSNNEMHHQYDQYDSIRSITNGNQRQPQQQLDAYGTYNGNIINQQQQIQQHYAYHNNDQNQNNLNSNNSSLNGQQAAYYGTATIKNGVNGNYQQQHYLQMNGGDYVENNLIQNNINNCTKHNNNSIYPNHNNNNNYAQHQQQLQQNGLHSHHPQLHSQQQQQINGNYITNPPNYLNHLQQQQFNQQDQYNQMQQNHMQTLNRRSNAIRPTQPPPQPPPPSQLNGSINSSSSQNEYHQTNGYVNHYSQSNLNHQSIHQTNNNNSLSNSNNQSHLPNNQQQQQQQSTINKPSDLPLPPPMPINLNGKLVSSATIQQQPNPPIPQAPIPPPPPMPQMNQQDVTDNAKTKQPEQNNSSNDSSSTNSSNNNTNKPLSTTKGATSFEQEILQKQKQLQPVKHIDRLPPKSDPRSDILAAIREGIKLKRVEASKQKETFEKTDKLLDVQSILQRRIAMELSDSDPTDTDNSNDDEWNDDDESHV